MAAKKKVKKTSKKTATPKAAKKKAARRPKAKVSRPLARTAESAPRTRGAAKETAAPVTLHAKPGDDLKLTTMVRNVVVPYEVGYEGEVVLFKTVNGSATRKVGPLGERVIDWAFDETLASDWSHQLFAQVNDGPAVPLLVGSASAGSPPRASGDARVIVE